MGGSSKSVTVGYKYYLGMHMVLCHGPIDYVTQVKVDGRLAWSGFAGDTQININKPGLFGGEDREGGVSGNVDIDMGGPNQGRNGYLQARLGNDIPAFRGVVSAVLRRCYLGLNPYLKPWSFRAQRVYTTGDGSSSQWYSSTAGIIQRDSSLLVYNENWSGGLSGYTLEKGSWDAFDISGGALEVNDGSTFPGSGAVQSRISREFLPVHWSNLSLDFLIKNEGSDPGNEEDVGVFQIEDSNGNLIFNFTGMRDATVDPQRRAHLTFLSGQTGLILSDNKLEEDKWYHLELFLSRATGAMYGTLSERSTGAVIKSATGLSLFSYGKAAKVVYRNETAHPSGEVALFDNISIYAGEQVDMNPAHIIRECLTDDLWGMGYLPADIDDTSFAAAADQLYSEGMGISLLWDRQMPIEDFIQEIIRHIDATLYVDRVSGKFVLKLIRNDYDEDTLLTLNESNIEKVSDYNRVDPGDAVNSVSVVYWDSKKGENGSVTVDDVALIQAYGSVVNTTIQYPGFTSSGLAARVAERDLRSLSSPLLSCTIVANREASGLNIGDVFKFEWPDHHEGYVLMRVNQIGFGDGKSNRVKITASEDVFSTPLAAVITEEDNGWDEPGGPPLAPPQQLALEAPYYELVQQLGQTDIDLKLQETPDIGYLEVAASRPENGLNAQLWVDSGAGYDEGGPLDFCPSATLGLSVDEKDTTWTFTDGSDLDQVAIGTHAQIDDELVRIDAIDEEAGTFTVGRAVMDTSPRKHAAGAAILFWDAYSASDNTEYVAGEQLDTKVLTNSSQGQLDLSSGVVASIVLDNRAIRPYPPGNFTVDGQAYPDAYAIQDTAVLSWAHRDRLQQTDGNLQDHTVGNIGPEAGTTYTVRVFSADSSGNKLTGTPFLEVTGLTGTSYTYDQSTDPVPAGAERLIFEVASVRDSYESMQSVTTEVLFLQAPTGLTGEYVEVFAPTGLTAENQ